MFAKSNIGRMANASNLPNKYLHHRIWDWLFKSTLISIVAFQLPKWQKQGVGRTATAPVKNGQHVTGPLCWKLLHRPIRQAHIGQRGNIPCHCTVTGLDYFLELRRKSVHWFKRYAHGQAWINGSNSEMIMVLHTHRFRQFHRLLNR